MSLIGKTVEEQVWNFSMVGVGNAYGVAALMGNLDAESGLNPKNLENLCERRLREAGKPYCTDETYTVAVDSGKISREEFLHPLPQKQYGYGLAQWTSADRKAGLYDYVKSKGVSIGDLETQLEYLFKELSARYKDVLKALKTASSVREASDIVLKKFECPEDQSEAVKKKRASYGQTYYDKYTKTASKPGNGGITMTGNELRQNVCNIINGWYGATKGSAKHHEILSTYNDHTPLARGYKVQVNDAYCATTVSAAYIKAGIAAYTGTECGVEKFVNVAQGKGIWEENDAHIPKLGEAVVYDWDDNGVGDNKGYSDHIGIVTQVNGTSSFTVTEGNMSGGKVGTRTMQVNGKYIRGFICPDFDTIAKKIGGTSGGSTTPAPAQPQPSTQAASGHKVGDVVNFTGNKHYTSAAATSSKAAKPGPAKVTAISAGAKHPYHLVHTDNTSNVYGWVDAGDIGTTATSGTSGAKTHKVVSGDTLSAIASKNGTTVAKIVAANKSKYPKITANYIVAGWTIIIPQ